MTNRTHESRKSRWRLSTYDNRLDVRIDARDLLGAVDPPRRDNYTSDVPAPGLSGSPDLTLHDVRELPCPMTGPACFVLGRISGVGRWRSLNGRHLLRGSGGDGGGSDVSHDLDGACGRFDYCDLCS